MYFESTTQSAPQHAKPLGHTLVMMPSQLAEAIEATAMLHALRQTHPNARITVLVKRRLRPVLWGLDSVDRVLSVRKRKRSNNTKQRNTDNVSLVRLGRRLSRGNFDTAIVLPESFRAAALAAVAGIPRRVGYEKDGSGVLLTDRLMTRRHRGSFIAVPALDRYLGIARYLGSTTATPTCLQHISPHADRQLTAQLTDAGLQPDDNGYALVIDTASEAMPQSENPIAIVKQQSASEGLPLLAATFNEHRRSRKQGTATAAQPRSSQLADLDFGDLSTDLHLLKALISRSRIVMTNSPGVQTLAQALGVACAPSASHAVSSQPVAAVGAGA